MRTSNIPGQQVSEAAVVTQVGAKGAETGVLAQDLMTELMGVVPVLGGRKVVVGFAGDQAFCDQTLSYVNIPGLPPSKVIPLQIAREIRGFAAHEAAHLAWTDPDVFPSQIIDAAGNYDPLLKETWNCIEDYMIERNWLELYPGARKNFAATEIRCCRSYMDAYTKDPDTAKDLRKVGPLALTWMRAMQFGLGTQISRECFETMPIALRNRVAGWFQDILDVETTSDCLHWARIIRNDIDQNPFDPANLPQNQQNAQNQGGQGQPAQQGGQGQGGQSKGAGGSHGTPQPGDPNGQAPAPMPTGSQLDQAISDAGLAQKGEQIINAPIFSTTTVGPAAEILSDPDGVTKAEAAKREVQGVIGSVASQLRKALKAAAKSRWKGGRMDGMLDHTRIASAMTGNIEIHKRLVRGEDVDTAVSIVIDCSGSMSGNELVICQQMAIVLESALAPTKVKHEIIGFTTGDQGDVDPAIQTAVQANQARGKAVSLRPVNIYEFRSFGQSHGSAMRTIGNMIDVPLGGTPTSEAILIAHDRLARRPEKRHVLIVITDGAPDDARSCRKAVNAVTRCGVTTVGVGICSDGVRSSFPDHVVIHNANDLPAVMMSKLTSILLGGKNTVALKGNGAVRERQKTA